MPAWCWVLPLTAIRQHLFAADLFSRMTPSEKNELLKLLEHSLEAWDEFIERRCTHGSEAKQEMSEMERFEELVRKAADEATER